MRKAKWTTPSCFGAVILSGGLVGMGTALSVLAPAALAQSSNVIVDLSVLDDLGGRGAGALQHPQGQTPQSHMITGPGSGPTASGSSVTIYPEAIGLPPGSLLPAPDEMPYSRLLVPPAPGSAPPRVAPLPPVAPVQAQSRPAPSPQPAPPVPEEQQAAAPPPPPPPPPTPAPEPEPEPEPVAEPEPAPAPEPTPEPEAVAEPEPAAEAPAPPPPPLPDLPAASETAATPEAPALPSPAPPVLRPVPLAPSGPAFTFASPAAAPAPEPEPVAEPEPEPEPEPQVAVEPPLEQAPQQAALPPQEDVPAAPEAPLNSLTVVFAVEQADLPATAHPDLDRLAQRLNQQETLTARLLAYASVEDDNASRARRLSLTRALAIRTYLMDRGVRSARIEVRALGSHEDGGSQPDRVDIHVIAP